MALCLRGGGTAAAYELPIHLSLTIWLAESAGFPARDAFEIAKYDQAVDNNPMTQPLWSLNDAGEARRAAYHFVGGLRLRELERAAFACTARPLDPAQYQRIGLYLHALEDTYSHKSYGPRLGHLLTLHTADKPWSRPADFVAMVQAKFEKLLTLRERCVPPRRPVPALRGELAEAFRILEAWQRDEFDGGVDDPESPGRFEVLARRLYGTRYQVYVVVAGANYAEWLTQQNGTGWRSP